jgi:hypothetical protein
MNGNTNNSPLLKVAPLWSKTSVKGGWYLAGRFGGVKILIMETKDRQGDDDPSHILYFTEAPDRRQGGQQAAPERSGDAGGTTHTPDRPEGIRRPPQRLPGTSAARSRRASSAGMDAMMSRPVLANHVVVVGVGDRPKIRPTKLRLKDG